MARRLVRGWWSQVLIVEVLLAIGLPLLALHRPGAAVAATIPLPIVAFYGVSVHIYPAILLVLVMAVLPTGSAPPRTPAWWRTAPIVALVVVACVQYALPSAVRSVAGNTFLTGFVCVVLAAAAAVLVRPDRRLVLAMVAATGAVYSLLALSQPLLSVSRDMSVVGQNANGLGFLAAVGLVAALTLALMDDSRWVTAAGLMVVAVCALGLMATSSVSSALTAGVGVIAVVIVGLTGSRVQRRRTTVVSVAVLLVSVVSIAPLWNQFGGMARDFAALQNSWGIRGAGTVAALHLFWSDPVTGAGVARSAQASFERGLLDQPVAPHNTFVGIASDLGVFGLLAFLTLIALVVRHLACRENRVMIPVTVAYLAGGLGIEWAINPALGIGFWVVAGTVIAQHVCRGAGDRQRVGSGGADDQVIVLPGAGHQPSGARSSTGAVGLDSGRGAGVDRREPAARA